MSVKPTRLTYYSSTLPTKGWDVDMEQVGESELTFVATNTDRPKPPSRDQHHASEEAGTSIYLQVDEERSVGPVRRGDSRSRVAWEGGAPCLFAGASSAGLLPGAKRIAAVLARRLDHRQDVSMAARLAVRCGPGRGRSPHPVPARRSVA